MIGICVNNQGLSKLEKALHLYNNIFQQVENMGSLLRFLLPYIKVWFEFPYQILKGLFKLFTKWHVPTFLKNDLIPAKSDLHVRQYKVAVFQLLSMQRLSPPYPEPVDRIITTDQKHFESTLIISSDSIYYFFP